MNVGTKITHEKLDEFKKVVLKSTTNYRLDIECEFGSNIHQAIDRLSNAINWAIMHVWDLKGELTQWLANDLCSVLVGTQDPDSLPKADTRAYSRERSFRGGFNSVEMVLGNIESKMFGDDEIYDRDEINQASESKQGMIEYEHDLTTYFK